MNKLKERKVRALLLAQKLNELYSKESGSALTGEKPWQFLVAVMLSARSTDKKVNEITPLLWKKYSSPKALAGAKIEDIENIVKPTGFYRTKARAIQKTMQTIVEEHGGMVPDSMEELVKLPGVGRKTANVVLGNVFKKPVGIPVDTHVRRYALKFDLTDNTNPEKIEKDLMEILPKKYWYDFPHKLIFYGREYCPARSHDCENHPLTKLYPPAARKWPKTL